MWWYPQRFCSWEWNQFVFNDKKKKRVAETSGNWFGCTICNVVHEFLILSNWQKVRWNCFPTWWAHLKKTWIHYDALYFRTLQFFSQPPIQNQIRIILSQCGFVSISIYTISFHSISKNHIKIGENLFWFPWSILICRRSIYFNNNNEIVTVSELFGFDCESNIVNCININNNFDLIVILSLFSS